VAAIRNELAHTGNSEHHERVTKTVSRACTLVDAAISEVASTMKFGDKPPYLEFNQEKQAWRLLRSIRGQDRYMMFDRHWHRCNQLEEILDIDLKNKSYVAINECEQKFAGYLSSRPYAAEIVMEGTPRNEIGARMGNSPRRADIVVYTRDGRVALVAEIKASRTSDLEKSRLKEQLWFTARAFDAPYAVIAELDARTWFAVDAKEGLREIPNDLKIVEQFPLPSADS
jgi:hypothetical protein